MAISSGIFVKIMLMPFLCLEKISEGFEFHYYRLPRKSRSPGKRSFQYRKVRFVFIIYARAITRPLVVPLPIQAKRVDYAEKQIRKFFKANAFWAICHFYSFCKTCGIGIYLLIRRATGESERTLGISANRRYNAVHSGEKMLSAPETPASKVNFFHTSTQ